VKEENNVNDRTQLSSIQMNSSSLGDAVNGTGDFSFLPNNQVEDKNDIFTKPSNSSSEKNKARGGFKENVIRPDGTVIFRVRLRFPLGKFSS